MDIMPSAVLIMHLSELTTEIRKKIDPYYQQQKCSPRTSTFGHYKVYVDVRGGSVARGLKR